MRRIKTEKRIAAYLMAIVLSATTLTGCGDGSAGVTDTDDGKPGSETVTDETDQETAMGRFIEKNVSLNDNRLTDWNSRLFRQPDGSLLLADNSGFVLRSFDNGQSWIREDFPWLARMSEEDMQIMSMAIGPDRTAAVVYTEAMDPENAAQMDMKLLLVQPDNTEIPVEIQLAEDDMWLCAVYISDTGRILVNAAGPNLYEVKTDGSSEVFLTVADGHPDLVQFHGNLLLLDGAGMDVPLIYDMEEREYIEDEVLAAFVKENFSDRDCYVGKYYDLFLTSGGDDAIYVAGKTGVYRHVLGGSMMEQILDGSLSILSNPANSIMDMLVVDQDEFLVLFTGGKLVRFVYDPDTPSRPSARLKVWSLEEEPIIRQAISLYQTENPAVYVEYEVGLERNAATRDDAIKNLNTRTMAGKGPDILILDDMPIDSYIEKGILMDIGPLLDGMSEEETVFPNVIDALKNDGHVYTVPCEIQLPYLLGRHSDLIKMTSMSGITDTMEELRSSNPGADLIRLSSPKGIMRIFSPASAPAWQKEDGTINEEAISDFLTHTKRMYDAQMDGLPEEAIEEWETLVKLYQEYDSVHGEELEDSDEFRNQTKGGYFAAASYFVIGKQQFAAGSLNDINDYNLHTSLPVMEGFEDCETIPMNAQCSNVFWAKTLVGINATSENTERAQDFLKTALSGDVQTNIQDGLPVTKQAILDNYANQWRLYKDNDYISGSTYLGTADGAEIDYFIRVPDEKKVNELIQWIESTDTAYVEDKIFENVVYEEGSSYMQGEKSLADAMASIKTRLGIYLAE